MIHRNNSYLEAISHFSKNRHSNYGGRIYIFSANEEDVYLRDLINKQAPIWSRSQLLENFRNKENTFFVSSQGPVWIYRRKKLSSKISHQGLLEDSSYSWYRDQVPNLISMAKLHSLQTLKLMEFKEDPKAFVGFLLGWELSMYSFNKELQNKELQNKASQNKESQSSTQIQLQISAHVQKKFPPFLWKKIWAEAIARGKSINQTRHWVNLPPNELHPQSYSKQIEDLFSSFSKTIKIEIWDEPKLKKEGMNLLLAVGQGGVTPPRLIHLRYIPSKDISQRSTSQRNISQRSIPQRNISQKNISQENISQEKRDQNKHIPRLAFVGKGITFDSGGLDIKPSAGMRWMKKDMAGSASVLGIAYWAAQIQYPLPLDFYVVLAENGVDSKSFRPGDIYTARNGKRVEIHNTDAEGRLILADALSLASESADQIVTLATLTGACRVALGLDLAGLFSNDDVFCTQVQQAGQRAGDLNWRLPLLSRYFSSHQSTFADFTNASEAQGGAITAALFLEKFIQNKPWVHLDFYGWSDKSIWGSSSGANGQTVQCCIEFLQAWADEFCN